ncbi:UDP-glucosyltransferase 2-like [Drosophila eugracilis]|uniref:UDP-glucosyltransferase 2-like n=1 Tax=Drosophila eugracilis TaxID=29029 RepID=UPI001BDB353C|nr:UDP-glucosyltransferase 2-like [Drosophila eugracilis]
MFAVRFVVLWLLAVVSSTQGANILGLYSSHSPSHLIIHMSTAKALAEAGHNVTVVSMLRPKVMHKDINLIVIPVTKEQERTLENQMTTMAGQKNSILTTMNRLLNDMDVMIDAQADLLSDPRFQPILETKFDLMILGYFLNDFQLGVAAKLKVPVIIDWMTAPNPIIDEFTGNPSEVSYVPNIATSATHPMGFLKRAENLAMHLFLKYMSTLLESKLTQIYKDIYGEDKNLPTLNELRKNISMAFVGSHLISEGPIRPLVPAIVEIGGIQVKDKPDPLPKDIDQFLNKSTQGAVFFSLGSNVKSSTVKPEIVQIIFKVLSSLEQNVIWKWEDLENTPGNVSNILYKNWLPQDDILAHPNTKLFITHAGKGGITESQYHGVPMVALPIFADQPGNAAAMEKSGYGLSLELLSITEDSLRNTISEVLENKKYSQAVGKFSALYRDRPLTAKQSVVYWTEYVLRHHGAPHLQSPSLHMNFIELNNLDIYALILIILALFVLLTRLIGKFLWRKVFVNAKISKSKNNQKKIKKINKKH